MKTSIKLSFAFALAASMFSSCVKEFLPTEYASQEQIDNADKAGLVSAVPAYMLTYSEDYYFDCGMASNGIFRDTMTADMPVLDVGYSYFTDFMYCKWLDGYWSYQYLWWRRYYALVQKCNLVFNAINVDEFPDDAEPAGTAAAYRANTYMELAQMYEFKYTGVPVIDEKAESAGIIGLTTPIVTEKTTEAEARNNPRAPFYTMYRFILNDLNNGEKWLKNYGEPSAKSYAGLGVIYGLKARFWLLMGSRFELHPDDLATAMAHENDADIEYPGFGVTSAKECFELAAEYANKAIHRGYTPLTEGQWYDPNTGFNSVNNAWMWAILINTDSSLVTSLTWQSWVSYMAPEADWGVASASYKATFMIDARLYSYISEGDWRRNTWIGPSDVANEKAFNEKYKKGLNIDFDTWKEFKAYCGFKYHPAQGNLTTSTVGNAVSIPMMRVEEMYLIEAEAVGRTQGEAAGRNLLEAFMNGYRMNGATYKSTGEGLEGFIDDVLTQKRIEFWGEGRVIFDFRRLEKAITRGYQGTNHTPETTFNSLPGYVAPWSTLSLPNLENNYNPACILNPDPSAGPYTYWEE